MKSKTIININEGGLGKALLDYLKKSVPRHWQVESKTQANSFGAPMVISIGIAPSFSVKFKVRPKDRRITIQSFRVDKGELKTTVIFRGDIPTYRSEMSRDIVNLGVINLILSYIEEFAA